MRILAILLTALAVLTTPAQAQEEGEGFLTRKIQDLLSGAGRTVDIQGFEGLLSSEASFDRMTIADEDGIWVTLEDVVLDWNRSALLRGRLEVERLSAARIDLPRLPKSEEEALPDAEATPFALPDLPVSIDIKAFEIAQVDLGAPLVGEPVQLSVTASALFNDDALTLDFQAGRTDGKAGDFDIKADLQRSENTMDLDIQLSEAENGIAARLLNIPDQPSVELVVAGAGPLDDFTTDLQLSTDGAERLAGQITLGTQAPRRASGAPDRRIRADIGGDITAVVLPEYRGFFGEDVALKIDALLESNGAIEVSELALDTHAADLTGRITLNAEKWPSFIDLEGTVANADGSAVLLPGGGGDTTVDQVTLRIDYDAAEDDAYDAAFDITGLTTGAARIARTRLSSTGTLQGKLGAVGQVLGDVIFSAEGLAMTDPALGEAIGTQISGKTRVAYIEGQPIRISNLDLAGSDYGLTGEMVINGIEEGLLTNLKARLEASDLSRFSALAGRPLEGQTNLALEGSVTPLSGAFDIKAQGSASGIRTGIVQADALLKGRTALSMQARRDETGTVLRDLVLQNPALVFTGEAELATDDSRVQARIALTDVAAVLPQYEGPITVNVEALQDTRGWTVDAVTDGPYGAAITLDGLATGPNAKLNFTAKAPEIKSFVPQIEGPLEASGVIRQTPQGWALRTDASGPYDVQASVDGLVTPTLDVAFEVALPQVKPLVTQIDGPLRASGRLRQTAEGFFLTTDASGPYGVEAKIDGQISPQVNIAFDVALPQINALVPQVDGPLNATGTLRQTAQGFLLDTNASGPYGADAKVQGQITPQVDVRFDLNVPNVKPLVPQVDGPLSATGRVRQTAQGFFVDTSAIGPYGARALVEGLATGPEMSLTFDVSVPNIQPLVPGVSGPLAAKGTVMQTPGGIAVNTNATGPYASRAKVEGVVTGPDANLVFDVSLPNVGALVPKISGPLDVQGSARMTPQGWQLDTDAQGPSGTQARIAGLVGSDGTLDLSVNGAAPLGLSAPFIAPRILQGQAQFDLSVNGPPALGSVTGTVRTSNASLSAPNLRVALENIVADIELVGGRANLDLQGDAVGGGRLAVEGGVTLTGALPADIAVRLNNVVVIDPKLYRTSVSGDLRVAGPLAGGAQISGQIDVGETNVTVPSTGLTTIGDIPQIRHVGAPAAATRTRAKAGLNGAEAGTDPAAQGGGAVFGLGIRINAPNRIFVRGRGLDAELGGGLTLTGDTARVISAGRFDLLRGRLDILGKRFDLVEGSIQFQGDLIPYLRFVSATNTNTGEVRVIVQGPADQPEVVFESTPDAPQDEVLAQLLFGRNISEISAFQALQLANAVATLAGRGGNGLISNLRDSFGLDDLDVTTTDDGATALRVGKYLTDNIYTDVTAASDGTGEVSLNLDISPSLTAKGTLGSDGNSSVGIFFERDY